MDISFEILLKCASCEAPLAGFQYVSVNTKGCAEIVAVEPCQKCLEQAAKEGYDDGREAEKEKP